MNLNIKKFTNINKFSFWLIFILNIGVVSFWLINNKFFLIHDFTLGGRLFDLHKAVLDGHIPPRWAENFGFGYGMPLFQYYAPLYFYLAEIFRLMGFNIILSLKLPIILMNIFGFYGMYLLGKKIVNHWAGLISATAFIIAPYHAVNIYVRGSFAELLAVMFFPWVFYFTLQILLFDTNKNVKIKSYNVINKNISKYYLGLTLSLVGIFLSHNVTVLTFIPIWGLFTGLWIIFYRRWLSSVYIAVATVHSVAISAFFLIPAFFTKGFTRVEEITGSGLSYIVHFLYLRQLFIPNWGYGGSVWGLTEDKMSFYLGVDVVILALIGGLIVFYMFWNRSSKFVNKISNIKRQQHLTLYLLLSFLLIISVLLTTFKSQFIWDNLPLIKFIQFPWRYLGVVSFLLAIMVGFIANFKYIKYFGYLIILIMLLANGRFFHPEYLIQADYLYNPTIEDIQTGLGGALPDYLPKGIKWEDIQSIKDIVKYDGVDAQYQVIKQNAKQISVQTQANSDGVLTIYRFVFPNWQIKLDNQLLQCEVVNYFYQCKIPTGRHNIQFYWSERGINLFSDILTIFGLVFAGLILLFFSKFRKV